MFICLLISVIGFGISCAGFLVSRFLCEDTSNKNTTRHRSDIASIIFALLGVVSFLGMLISRGLLS